MRTRTDGRTDGEMGEEIKILSQKHALKATACKSLPLGDNIIITNPYMNALPFVNMKTTTTTTIRRTIMKSNQIMVTPRLDLNRLLKH